MLFFTLCLYLLYIFTESTKMQASNQATALVLLNVILHVNTDECYENCGEYKPNSPLVYCSYWYNIYIVLG